MLSDGIYEQMIVYVFYLYGSLVHDEDMGLGLSLFSPPFVLHIPCPCFFSEPTDVKAKTSLTFTGVLSECKKMWNLSTLLKHCCGFIVLLQSTLFYQFSFHVILFCPTFFNIRTTYVYPTGLLCYFELSFSYLQLHTVGWL